MSAAAAIIVGCATHQQKIAKPITLLKEGKFQEAIEILKPLADKASDDQLLYLMELGSAYQMAGQYEESNKVFIRADKLTEIQDYHSVSNLTLATLGSEEMVQYKGESYEKLLINVSLALNFAMMGKLDDALVECRRINEKILLMRQNNRKDYEDVPFASYLSGLLWEADQKYDDAIISMESSYAKNPNLPFIEEDLIRLSKKSHRDESYRKWKKQFSQIKENPDWYNKNKGEVIIFIMQGWGPHKTTSFNDHRMPTLRPTFSQTKFVRASLSSDSLKKNLIESSVIAYDIERAAIETLNADYAALVARRLAAYAAKEVVADQIRQKDELLGLVALIGMHLSDRADLRQWTTLPQTLQILRFWVDPGEYNLNLQGLDQSQSPTDQLSVKINAKSGRKTFYFWRPLS